MIFVKSSQLVLEGELQLLVVFRNVEPGNDTGYLTEDWKPPSVDAGTSSKNTTISDDILPDLEIQLKQVSMIT